MENPTDLHREQKRQFAHEIARAVHERYATKSFDRLVVVAPAVTMGDLRAALADDIKAITTAELVADLTKTPTAELPSHLTEVIEL
jgi:protein required for attachment to host cells